MNKKIKKEWIKALRSGEYKQGKGKLCRSEDGGETYQYCCLGVLIDIAYDGDWFLCYYEDDPTYGLYDGNDFEATELPYEFYVELKLEESSLNTLMKMNDGTYQYKEKGGYSFDEIADWIEENL